MGRTQGGNLYTLDKERARKILLEEKLTPFQADNLLNHYPPIHDSLRGAIDQWLEERTMPEVAVEGITLGEVMEKRHCHFLIAIRDLSRLLTAELTPEKREQWHRILTTPVYYE
jgi:hypothetical protein